MAVSLAMLKGVRKANLLQSCNALRNLSTSSKLSAKDDVFHQPDVSPEEMRLVEERQKIRKALRKEYLRKLTDPHGTDPIVFDPAVQRYYSMHMTIGEKFIPTFKSWLKYMFSIVVPIVVLALYLKHARGELERKYRSGEIEYKHRMYRHQ